MNSAMLLSNRPDVRTVSFCFILVPVRFANYSMLLYSNQIFLYSPPYSQGNTIPMQTKPTTEIEAITKATTDPLPTDEDMKASMVTNICAVDRDDAVNALVACFWDVELAVSRLLSHGDKMKWTTVSSRKKKNCRNCNRTASTLRNNANRNNFAVRTAKPVNSPATRKSCSAPKPVPTVTRHNTEESNVSARPPPLLIVHDVRKTRTGPSSPHVELVTPTPTASSANMPTRVRPSYQSVVVKSVKPLGNPSPKSLRAKSRNVSNEKGTQTENKSVLSPMSVADPNETPSAKSIIRFGDSFSAKFDAEVGTSVGVDFPLCPNVTAEVSISSESPRNRNVSPEENKAIVKGSTVAGTVIGKTSPRNLDSTSHSFPSDISPSLDEAVTSLEIDDEKAGRLIRSLRNVSNDSKVSTNEDTDAVRRNGEMEKPSKRNSSTTPKRDSLAAVGATQPKCPADSNKLRHIPPSDCFKGARSESNGNANQSPRSQAVTKKIAVQSSVEEKKYIAEDEVKQARKEATPPPRTWAQRSAPVPAGDIRTQYGYPIVDAQPAAHSNTNGCPPAQFGNGFHPAYFSGMWNAPQMPMPAHPDYGYQQNFAPMPMYPMEPVANIHPASYWPVPYVMNGTTYYSPYYAGMMPVYPEMAACNTPLEGQYEGGNEMSTATRGAPAGRMSGRRKPPHYRRPRYQRNGHDSGNNQVTGNQQSTPKGSNRPQAPKRDQRFNRS